jgi:hypothetical protein
MGPAGMRFVAAAATMAALILSVNPGLAQSADPKAGAQRQQGAEVPDGQKRVNELIESAKLLKGPAGNPECVWVGENALSRLYHDDLDTAFRHMELYDRFGCPSGHVQAAFRCLIMQPKPDFKDPKTVETLSARAHACWINPTPDTPPPSAAAPSPTTSR